MTEPQVIPLPELFTRHPDKWRLIDTETGQTWKWNGETWAMVGLALNVGPEISDIIGGIYGDKDTE